MRRSISALVLVLLASIAVGCDRQPSNADDVRMARQVVEDVSLGRFELVRARFDDVMDASLSTRQLATLWERYTAVHGALVSQGSPRTDQRGRVTIVSIPLQMRKSAGQARVSFNSDGKIVGLYFLQPTARVP